MNHINDVEQQENDRAYEEYAQVQQGLEKAAQEEITRLVAQAEPMIKMFDHFILKVFR